ncbi:OsmC/Ohr family protein, partial [Kipferlia bialata]|eukprot:g12126.t1
MVAVRIAKETGLAIDRVTFKSSLTLDKATLKAVPAGQCVTRVTLEATVYGDVTEEQVTELGEKVHVCCPVAAIFRHLPGCEFEPVWTLAKAE